jgi:REP-associated tyrosine transposase
MLERLGQVQGLSAGKYLMDLDLLLDRAAAGACWLRDAQIADRVMAAIRRGDTELGHYALRAFVIMPNHIHLLVDPRVQMEIITKGLKGLTARTANAMLGRTGQPFWQDESFDHWVQNANQFERIRKYIERNPVAAGLVQEPDHWPWSSASPR